MVTAVSVTVGTTITAGRSAMGNEVEASLNHLEITPRSSH